MHVCVKSYYRRHLAPTPTKLISPTYQQDYLYFTNQRLALVTSVCMSMHTLQVFLETLSSSPARANYPVTCRCPVYGACVRPSELPATRARLLQPPFLPILPIPSPNPSFPDATIVIERLLTRYEKGPDRPLGGAILPQA